MKIKELIEKLQRFNKDLDVDIATENEYTYEIVNIELVDDGSTNGTVIIDVKSLNI